MSAAEMTSPKSVSAASVSLLPVRFLGTSTDDDVRREMIRVGCDLEGVRIMAPLARTIVLRVENLSAPAANILKQEMLAVGGDAATHRETITAKAPRGPAVIFGTRRALLLVAHRLGAQPFGLAAVGRAIRQVLETSRAPRLTLRGRSYPPGRTLVMGVLNVTPDSFSDGGRWLDPADALQHAEQMLADGADLIDVGGASTRPGAEPAPESEELARVLPVLDGLRVLGAAVSIDTSTPRVAEAACERGAVLVNNVTGLRDSSTLAEIAARAGAGVCVMHMRGEPRTMQKNVDYDDLVGEVMASLAASVRRAEAAGIPRASIVVDPGIGFGKSGAQNLVLLRRLGEFATLGQPILIGTSRKSFLGTLAAENGVPAPVEDRLAGSLASAVAASLAGARILRVHDVCETVQALRVADAIRSAREEV
jgi:dihydropteroate synthase